MVSIEYLFRECNMHHHALGLELHNPVRLCGELAREIVLLKINCCDKEVDQLTRNVLNKINTNSGVYSMSVSDNLGNPYNEQKIEVDIENILNAWSLK